MVTFHGILSRWLLPKLLGETDENSFGTPDVAEPVDVFIIDNFIDQRPTELAEPGKSVVDLLAANSLASLCSRLTAKSFTKKWP
jgi:hypothetical protein